MGRPRLGSNRDAKVEGLVGVLLDGARAALRKLAHAVVVHTECSCAGCVADAKAGRLQRAKLLLNALELQAREPQSSFHDALHDVPLLPDSTSQIIFPHTTVD